VVEPLLNGLVSERVRTYGRFASRPRVVDPLRAFAGVEQRLRRLRLKEWIGFTLIHPELYSSLVIQDAHYLASSEIYTFDGRRGELHEHTSNARGGSPTLPPPLSVSSWLPGGAMYTHKRLYPASGSIRVGDSEFVFDPARDLAILDEHGRFSHTKPAGCGAHSPTSGSTGLSARTS
jgi:hypothetical protein